MGDSWASSYDTTCLPVSTAVLREMDALDDLTARAKDLDDVPLNNRLEREVLIQALIALEHQVAELRQLLINAGAPLTTAASLGVRAISDEVLVPTSPSEAIEARLAQMRRQ